MKKIISISYRTPCNEIKYIPFNSDASLLDADIVIFTTSFPEFIIDTVNTYLGKPSLSDTTSFQLKEITTHWRREINDALNAGKNIIVFLDKLTEVYIATGEEEYSGTGKNRIKTRIVETHSNYKSLPISLSVLNSKGSLSKLSQDADVIKSYWENFKDLSSYQVKLEGDIEKPLIVTKTGNKVLGCLIKKKQGGHMILLPYFTFYNSTYIKEYGTFGNVMKWSQKAIILGKKFLSDIVEIDKTLRMQEKRTPTPNWAFDSMYILPIEAKIQKKILEIELKINDLVQEKEQLSRKLQDEIMLRNLLYEKNTPLEDATLKALGLMGFKVTQYKDSESEFDAVFQAVEGRFLGEVEGKDNKPVNVDKLRQLEMNILEDYERDEVASLAKGVLFGNAYRLTEPTVRAEFFTNKCITAAKLKGVALVRTPDLFFIAQYLSNKEDENFARLCREAILSTSGEIVTFPTPPIVISTKLTERIDKKSK